MVIIVIHALDKQFTFLWLLGDDDETYGVVYEVIQDNSGASLEPLWAVKVARSIATRRISHTYSYPANTF